MTSVETTSFLRQLTPTTCEFKLSRGESYRLRKRSRRITVLEGCAWLSVGQKDVILIPGDALDLAHVAPQDTLLTAMGHTPLVFCVV